MRTLAVAALLPLAPRSESPRAKCLLASDAIFLPLSDVPTLLGSWRAQ